MLKPATNRFAVLKVEVVPCDDTAALAPRLINPTMSRLALQKIGCITLLHGEESGGRFRIDDIRTFSLAEHEEADIIGMLDMLLPPCRLGNALVTFGGAVRDFPLLILRACALWMVPLENLAAWTVAPPTLHVDLARDVYASSGRPRFSLADIAAAQGLAIRQGVRGKSVHWLHVHGRYDEIEARNRMDVVAAFVTHAAHRSFITGHDGYLLSAWAELGRTFEQASNPGEKLLADHCLVKAAKQGLEPTLQPPAEDPF